MTCGKRRKGRRVFGDDSFRPILMRHGIIRTQVGMFFFCFRFLRWLSSIMVRLTKLLIVRLILPSQKGVEIGCEVVWSLNAVNSTSLSFHRRLFGNFCTSHSFSSKHRAAAFGWGCYNSEIPADLESWMG